MPYDNVKSHKKSRVSTLSLEDKLSKNHRGVKLTSPSPPAVLGLKSEENDMKLSAKITIFSEISVL